MKVNVTLTRKIVFNGKEYASVDELPEDVRAAFRKAVADGALERAAAADSRASARIAVGDTTYDSPDSMPPEIRRLLDDAVAVAKSAESPAFPRSTAGGGREAVIGADSEELARLASSPAPVGPSTSTRTSRLSVALVVGLVLLVLFVSLSLR